VTDSADHAVWPVARLRQIGGGAWIGAAALAAVGSFLPLVEQHYGPTSSFTISIWGYASDGDGELPDLLEFPPMGVALMIGAVLQLAAGLLSLASTRLHPASGAVLASRLIGTGAIGLVVGTATTAFLALRVFVGTPEGAPADYARVVGFGAWMLLGSMVVGLAAIALMLVPRLGRRGEEPDTPPMGIPVVRVLEPEYEETDPKG
jgi:hypothetical protein